MALPPLPPNSTRRLYLDYSAGSFQHTMMLRLPTTGADPSGYAQNYATVFAQRMRNTESFFGARLATVGSDVTLPIAFTTVVGVLPFDVPTWSQDPESTQLSITFRGAATGRKSRVEFFTPVKTTDWPADNRYNPGDSAPIGAMLANFIAGAAIGGSFPLLTVGGDGVYVHDYVNIRQNGYWQTRQR